jgi:glyoxylase-like metal-dependent hydrolase (beta-lactamase superfamily II)/rhodanese-related sulfurtransferase
MHIQQLYTNCLAEAAYYIESDGEAAIIDPIRETEPYTSLAKERNTKIKYIFETHFHADFVSGHIDLAAKTGAQIIYGPGADTAYKVYNAKDGEEFSVGKIKIKVLHTPGHTLESSCYLLIDENGKEHCIFTGDTLFVGDVGRPDLLDGSGITKEFLAGKMYDSLNTKIKILADDVIVYPAHGPGSACGKNIGKETWSTIGHQKQMNYYLHETDKQKFITTLTTGITPPPLYFFEDARINKQGYSNIDEVVKKNSVAFSVSDFEKQIAQGCLILDTRIPHDFETGFIPGSLNIGLNGQYANWIGTLIHIEQPIVLVTDLGKEDESILRAARVGYENIRGFLAGGFDTWKNAGKKIDTICSITAEEYATKLKAGDVVTLDVRKESEFETAHVKNALLLPLSDVATKYETIDKHLPYAVTCASGYRSMIAASMLKVRGFTNITNVHGGFGKIKNCGVEIEAGIIQN